MCVSLLSLFDFRGDKRVTRQDWIRGTRALTLHSLGEDDTLWELLLQKFDTRREGWVDLHRIEDLVPIDPRISLLMKAMFNSVTTLSDGMLRAQGKMETGETLRKNRVVINLRKRLLEPPFGGWRDHVFKARSLRLRTIKRALQRNVAAAWNQWTDAAEERRRLQKFMRRALNGAVTSAWFKWLSLLEGQAKMQKFARRMMNRSLAKGFSAWEDMLHQRKRMQRFMVRRAQRSTDCSARVYPAKFLHWPVVPRGRALSLHMASVTTRRLLSRPLSLSLAPFLSLPPALSPIACTPPRVSLVRYLLAAAHPQP